MRLSLIGANPLESSHELMHPRNVWPVLHYIHVSVHCLNKTSIALKRQCCLSIPRSSARLDSLRLKNPRLMTIDIVILIESLIWLAHKAPVQRRLVSPRFGERGEEEGSLLARVCSHMHRCWIYTNIDDWTTIIPAPPSSPGRITTPW